ncbi:MAG: Ppx/GppA phosphatase family protein [Alphaproteobacteria bacterium]
MTMRSEGLMSGRAPSPQAGPPGGQSAGAFARQPDPPARRPAARGRSRGARGDGMAYAAIDLGTNNCRLLVAEPLSARPGGQRFRVIDAFSRIVRLGEGLQQNGVLSQPAMDRAIRALGICARKVSQYNIAGQQAVATEACRRAANCEEFLDRARAETGLDLTIIDVQEEAALAVTGCCELLDRNVPYAVIFDIGGGSTEVIWIAVPTEPGAEPHILATLSVPTGVVTLAETFGGDRITDGVFEEMVGAVADALEPFERQNGIGRHIGDDAVQMIGTSGTVTTLAGLRLGLRRYDRRRVDGTYLAFTDARAVTGRLLELDYAGRAAQPCIGQDRADLVVAGCAILEAICRSWPVGNLRVADRGLREGILHRLMPAA